LLLAVVARKSLKENPGSSSTTDNKCVTFEEAILQGYAPDGVLFVLENLPKITAGELQRWACLSYTLLMFHVLWNSISSKKIIRSLS